MYCLRCKRHTETLNETTTVLKNGRPAKRGTCAVCGIQKFQFLSSQGSRSKRSKRVRGGSLLNSALNALPMPEMHMSLPPGAASEDNPGGSFQNTGKYSYCGPFTKLDKRLTQHYRGVNKLDRACLDHDVAYAVYKDTAGRNHADDILAAAASKIALVALTDEIPEYEKKDARLVAAIMSSKSKMGMGYQKKR